MSSHSPVLFVGDRPNPRKNLSMDVPFVGTPSYKTLLEWFYRMDVDVRYVITANAFTAQGDSDELLKGALAVISEHKGRVVALGEAARGALVELGVACFVLPHPSGLNRDLNDKKKLSEKLAKCRAFIYDQK